jgi:hypothetical protein
VRLQFVTAAGRYAAGAHRRPVGSPHHGPDEVGNVLCQCPTIRQSAKHAEWLGIGIYTCRDGRITAVRAVGCLRGLSSAAFYERIRGGRWFLFIRAVTRSPTASRPTRG